MREMADMLDRAGNNIASIYAERSGVGDVESWRAAMSAETWYSAQECVDAGLADEVDGQTEEASNVFDLSIYAYAGRKFAPEPKMIEIEPIEEKPQLISPEEFRDIWKGAFA
jgi:hypothetical protein